MLSKEVSICGHIALGDFLQVNTQGTLCWYVRCASILTDYGWLYPGEVYVKDNYNNFVTQVIVKLLPGTSKFRLEFEIPRLAGGIYTVTYDVETGITNTEN